uniref:ATP synthase F0 subunit 6 n=1 Tax=Monacha cartusiana TaxID=225461 RepID=UPI0023D7E2A5|nr:ATP synthase F0 subunit 6 [Monacha cartusiana]URP31102.1 ATP synthase F0 subunit 6 [Monacha cartusiana]
MYTDLFSSLDGAYKMSLWLPSGMVIFTMSTYYFVMNVNRTLFDFTWADKSAIRYNAFSLVLSSVFIMIITLNYIGLTPFSYTLSSNLFSLSSLAILLWGLVLLSGYFKDPVSSVAHLAPSGAPLGLLPFLVIIETISLLIRPLTLTVRLMANISAGHIVLGLVANTLSTILGSLAFLPMFFLIIGYMLFEFFVSMIQAYIFTLLIMLYQNEHP